VLCRLWSSRHHVPTQTPPDVQRVPQTCAACNEAVIGRDSSGRRQQDGSSSHGAPPPHLSEAAAQHATESVGCRRQLLADVGTEASCAASERHQG
jgi:hypothetical protein